MSKSTKYHLPDPNYQINYLKQIRFFGKWFYKQDHTLSWVHFLVYHVLFDEANERHFPEWYEITQKSIMEKAGIKRRETLIKVLISLRNERCIDYEQGDWNNGQAIKAKVKIMPGKFEIKK